MRIADAVGPGILIAFISIPIMLKTPLLQTFTGQTPLSVMYFQTHNQGLDRAAQQDYKGAIAAYSETLQIGEKLQFIDAHTYVNRGLAYYKLGQAKRAILNFNQALKIEPRRAHTYNDRGRSYQSLGDLQAALENYNQALKLDPKFSEAYSNRGIIHARLGKTNLALDDQTRALHLNPHFAAAYYNRGNLHLSLTHYPKAIDDYTQALHNDPQLAPAYYNRGNVRYLTGDREGALQDLQTAANLFVQQNDTENYQRSQTLLHQLNLLNR